MCASRARLGSASEEIKDADVEAFMDHLRELKIHEEEIREVRQELQMKVQRHKMNKLIASKRG